MKERRKFARFDLRLPASIEVLTPGRGRDAVNLPTNDICAGGAFFRAAQPYPEGAKVRVELVFGPNGVNGKEARVKLKGKVVRCDARGMAIRFDKRCRMSPQQDPKVNSE